MHYTAMPNQFLRQREVPVYAAAEDAIDALALRGALGARLRPHRCPCPPLPRR